MILTSGKTIAVIFLSFGSFSQKTTAKPEALNGGNLELVLDVFPGQDGTPIDFLLSQPLSNGKTVFVADDGVTGREPWISDGTTEGTKLIQDVWVGTSSSTPYNAIEYDNHLYFVADDGVHGLELWKCDLEGQNAALWKDFSPGAQRSYFGDFAVLQGYLFMVVASDATTSGYALWKTDGTSDGTIVVKEGMDEMIRDAELFDDKLLIAGESSLWSSDGTTEGTTLLANLDRPRVFQRQPEFNDGSTLIRTDEGLWKTDGTAVNTEIVIANLPVSRISQTVLNGNVLLAVDSSTIFTSDGTQEGTAPLHCLETFDNIHCGEEMIIEGFGNVSAFAKSSTSDNGAVFFGPASVNGDSIHFSVDSPGMNEFSVWATDGTTSNTYLLQELGPGRPHDAFTLTDGRFVFRRGSPDQVWITDGTETGTYMLVDWGTDSEIAFSANSMARLTDKVILLAGWNSSTGAELWRLSVPGPPLAVSSSDKQSYATTTRKQQGFLVFAVAISATLSWFLQ